MKVLVFGAQGMLGRDLMDVLKKEGCQALGLDLADCDMTNAPEVHKRIGSVSWKIHQAPSSSWVSDVKTGRQLAIR
jgi:dTDP-4-dehydrorhamnose reductase